MKPYSTEFREKIVKAYEQCDTSIRIAARFDVSKAFVQKLLKQKQTTGYVQPKNRVEALKCVTLADNSIDWDGKYPDSTLLEYCEYWLDSKEAVSPSMMCRELKTKNWREKRQYR